MSTESSQIAVENQKRRWTFMLYRGIGALVAVSILVYVVFVVVNGLPETHRLGIADVVLLLVVALLVVILWRPDLLDRSKPLENVGNQGLKNVGIQSELLEQLQEDNKKQRAEVEEIRLLLTLLLLPSETSHLRNLAKGGPMPYRGNDDVRRELRKLRSLGLAENQPGRSIGELANGKTVDLCHLLRLTARARLYAPKLDELMQDEQAIDHDGGRVRS